MARGGQERQRDQRRRAGGGARRGGGSRLSRKAGLLYGFAAYGMWGLFPLYWPLLQPAGALEILAHRMVWSLATVALALLALRRWGWIPGLLRQPRKLGLITVAAAVITVNWGLYIWSVNAGYVVESSLGYFINPLVTIAMGVLLLKERLRPALVDRGRHRVRGRGGAGRRLRAPAVDLPGAGVLVRHVRPGEEDGQPGRAGVAGRGDGDPVPARAGVPAVAGLAGLRRLRRRGRRPHGPLLASAGLVTAVPLVCFGAAAIRVPLSTIGLLQYLAPVFQFLLGVLYFREAMPPERWAASGWCGWPCPSSPGTPCGRHGAPGRRRRPCGGRRADSGGSGRAPSGTTAAGLPRPRRPPVREHPPRRPRRPARETPAAGQRLPPERPRPESLRHARPRSAGPRVVSTHRVHASAGSAALQVR